MTQSLSFSFEKSYDRIKEILETARKRVYRAANLWNMIRFYKTFPILDAVRRELSWTHYRLLMRVENGDAREFYIQEAIEGNWSTRQLDRQINSLHFERVLISRKEGRAKVKKELEEIKEEKRPLDFIKDPYVLEFLDMKTNMDSNEIKLEQALIDKLQEFLLELGKGFSFVRRQYRVSAEGNHFYVDLVFYNYILKTIHDYPLF